MEKRCVSLYKPSVGFDIFLSQASTTGKNPWKKYHEPEIVNYLNKVQLKNIDFSS